MTILTPEIIEKAARAINPHVWDKAPGANWQHDVAQMMAIADATAALEAALPSLVEGCAKVADEHRGRIPGHCPDRPQADKVAQGYSNAALNIATAIRSLLNKEGRTNG